MDADGAAHRPSAGCPIDWRPSPFAPVFYGYQDCSPDEAPTRLRIFYPSVADEPRDAAPLDGCGGYPLIIFAHGVCDDDNDHYLRWFRLPSQLARCGYVVAVPQLGDGQTHPASDAPTQRRLVAVLRWMRDGWPGRARLLPPPATGLIGHSDGALHAGIAGRSVPVGAVASLSGPWLDWPRSAGPRPIVQGSVPRFFSWGTEFSEADAMLPTDLWEAIDRPKHRVVITGGEHFDCLEPQQLPCGTGAGDCPHVGTAIDDLLIMFVARYLPTEHSPGLDPRVPDNLVPPPPELDARQSRFAEGHLTGLARFTDAPACDLTITAELPVDRVGARR